MSSVPSLDLSDFREDRRDGVLALVRERDALRETNTHLEHLVAELNQGRAWQKVLEAERQLA